MEHLLEVDALDIAFRSRKQLVSRADRVSFHIDEGEILCIVGESGCGKSITALSILGLLPRQGQVTGGEVRFQGQNLLALDDKALDRVRGSDISMIFQDIMYSLNPVFTIGNQITEGLRRHLHLRGEEASRRAISLMEKTGIQDAPAVMRKYPHQLSGGMRQRVMIAMALACRPKLLIADEPTTALDVTIQLQIMQLLRRLRDETGMAILLITHDIGVVAEMADRVLVMYAGQVVEEAPVQALLEHPAHPYTRALLQAVPGLHDDRSRRLYTIPGMVPEHYDSLTGCRFAPRCPHAAQCGGQAAGHQVGREHWALCALAGGERYDG